jgi:hypothetical protein
MSDLAILQTRLAEAEAAHHKLMTGASVTLAESSGRKVGYAPADADKLQVYISTLKKQIAALSDTPGSRRRRALTVSL